MKQRIFLIILVVLSLGWGSWLFLPKYMQQALLHLNPDITDYTIFHNRTIVAGNPLPWPIHDGYNAESVSKSALLEFEKYGTVAFLVVKDGKLLHEEYWDGYNDSTVSNSFSMAKSVISLLIGCLADEGKLSLSDPVVRYIPELKDDKDNPITIKHLLTMSSGLDWDESYNNLTSVTTKSYYGSDITKLVTTLKKAEKPGATFRYKGCDSQLLGIIIERVSGMPVSDYASLKLWRPLGAEKDALWSLDKKNGKEKTFCCFNATARDFARIGQLVLDSGSFDGKQLVSKAYLQEATAPCSWLRDEDGKPCTYYGYQFWLTETQGHKVIYARGILGQYIFVIPSLNAVIVRLGKERSSEYVRHDTKDCFVYLNEGIRLARKP
ncbi:MAG TPA: serine hydrolase [Bacteroidales bacterium]|nr:serine hydrolase [Bacteroidales bacterium]HPT01062.1 serine hydrolase [Bacteroidales bacterium]